LGSELDLGLGIYGKKEIISRVMLAAVYYVENFPEVTLREFKERNLFEKAG